MECDRMKRDSGKCEAAKGDSGKSYVMMDIGSHSIRLALYREAGDRFELLHKEKRMVGLAGYVRAGILEPRGVEAVVHCLSDFREIYTRGFGGADIRSSVSQCGGIADTQMEVMVLATASLRNIANAEEVKCEILSRTGFSVIVLSGEQEAIFGYIGAREDLRRSGMPLGKRGAYADVGGGSTELVFFSGDEIAGTYSLPVGALNLYHDVVRCGTAAGALSTAGAGADTGTALSAGTSVRRSQKVRVEEHLAEGFRDVEVSARETVSREDAAVSGAVSVGEESPTSQNLLICVGGTARAFLKVARALVSEGERCDDGDNGLSVIPASVLFAFCRDLEENTSRAWDLLRTHAPERLHTMYGGLKIFEHLCRILYVSDLVISQSGVREGVLYGGKEMLREHR